MALINCKECGGTVSDKALSCPHCGFPLVEIRPQAKTVSRYRKLPNGTGTIRKLAGRRRNPYAVYPPVKEWNNDGTPVQTSAIGYFKTWNDAYNALSEYNKNPYDLKNDKLTFAEVYQLFYDDKFSSKTTFSVQLQNSLRFAFKCYKPLHNKTFCELKTMHYQQVIDCSSYGRASLELMLTLIKQMYKFAIRNDIVDKDYGKYVTIKSANDDEKGVPFTAEEIRKLWALSENYCAQVLLILIHTGLRISELKKTDLDIENHCLVGGVKTKAGKGRIIPVHNDIWDFMIAFNKDNFTPERFRVILKRFLIENGLYLSDKDTIHTPHDCRHTFSWLWDRDVRPADDFAKHLVMGHSLGNDIESNTYGHRTIEELKEKVNMISTK